MIKLKRGMTSVMPLFVYLTIPCCIDNSEFVELTNYSLSLYSDILWLFACMVGILSDLIRNRSL